MFLNHLLLFWFNPFTDSFLQIFISLILTFTFILIILLYFQEKLKNVNLSRWRRNKSRKRKKREGRGTTNWKWVVDCLVRDGSGYSCSWSITFWIRKGRKSGLRSRRRIKIIQTQFGYNSWSILEMDYCCFRRSCHNIACLINFKFYWRASCWSNHFKCTCNNRRWYC